MTIRRALVDGGATLVNLLAAMAVDVARVLTAPGRAQPGNKPRGAIDRLCIVTPLAPSEQSGGGKAVKELQDMVASHLATQLIELPALLPSGPTLRARLSDWAFGGLPALRSSKRLALNGSAVRRRLPTDTPVFIEFSEGALFIAFARRLQNYTVLRDHELLLRRFFADGAAGGLMRRLRRLSEQRLCRAVLANIYCKVDLIIVLTDEDRTLLRARFGALAPDVVTIPVPFHRAGPTQSVGASTQSVAAPGKQLLFLGNLHHAPNLEGLHWFMRECAPHLESGFTLHLCGIDAPLDQHGLACEHVRLVRHGFLHDIESELDSIRIGIAPVISGGGTRIKNLYLGATGRVVVTTPLGNEGIGYRDEHEALVCSDGVSMASALNRIAADPERAQRLGLAAARKVESDFGPKRIWAMYEALVFGARQRSRVVGETPAAAR